MRSLVAAAPAATIGRSAHLRAGISLALVAAVFAILLIGAPVAEAAKNPLFSFGSGGSLGGQLERPGGLAVNASGAGDADPGDLYVANAGNHRIEQFDAEGDFIRAFGFDVVLSGEHNSIAAEQQMLTVRASSGRYRLQFSNDATPMGSIGDWTYRLPFDATAAEVEDGLNKLSPINGVDGEVSVSGGPGDASGSNPYTITFEGALAGNDVQLLQDFATGGDSSEPLAGGVPSTGVFVTTTSPGGGPEKCEAGSDPADVCKTGALAVGSGGAFNSPTGVDVDQGSGDVYVLDAWHQRVQKLDGDGDFLLAFGKDVIADGKPGDTGTGYEVCTVAADCKTGESGSLGGEFSFGFGQPQLAVVPAGAPNAGNVLVADPENRRVQEFTPGGAFVRAFGFDVAGPGAGADDTGSGFEVCTAAVAGAANCQAGTAGDGVGQFGEGGPQGVAADSTGAIYTVERSSNFRVQKFTPQGGAPGLAPAVFAAGTVSGADGETTPTNVRVGPGDDVFVAKATPAGATPACPNGEASEAERRVLELDSTGSLQDTHLVCAGITSVTGLAVEADRIYVDSESNALEGFMPRVFAAEELTSPSAGIEPVSGIDGYGATFHGSVDPNGSPSNYRFEYSTDGATWTALGQGLTAESDSPVPVSQVTAALQPGTDYQVRLRASKPFGGPGTLTGTVSFSTPLPAPSVSRDTVVSGAAAATLAGTVNPNGSATDYHFEYGPADCAANPCESTPEQSLPGGTEDVYVTAQIGGLDPATTYHYRLVAGNASGTTAGPDLTFQTSKPLVAQLPDGRAYEQVSPVDKESNDVFNVHAVAAENGDRFVFNSQGSFAGQETSQSYNYYMSVRGPNGWTTKGIMPPGGRLHFQNGYRGYSDNLERGVVRWMEDSPMKPPIDPAAPKGMNLYMFDTASWSFELLNGSLMQADSGAGFGGGTPDFSAIAYETTTGLTPEAPCHGGDVFDACVYENAAGGLRLVSVLPSGRATKGAIGAGIAGSPGNTDNVMSDDGHRIFWSAIESGGPLHARVDGASSVLLSGSERSTPGTSAQQVWYQGAEAAHGNRVLFTTKNALVDADTNATNDLYLYDWTAPEGDRLTLISEDRNPAGPLGANVPETNKGGVVAKSEDLRRVYFVTENQILEDAPATPGPHLYLWDDTGGSGELTHIGELSSGDSNAWKGASVDSGNPTGMKTARASTDGRYLAFLSNAKLTAFENNGEREAYVYDALDGSLVCASCSPDAQPAQGFVNFDENIDGPPNNHLLENVSDDGHVFFETNRGLVPRDSNGVGDVYEYSDGQLFLISTGTDGTRSRFLDATPSGSDVFFTTRAQLVGWDTDQNIDAYTARIGGGFPEPPPSPPACEGEACQPPPVTPNDPTPASAGYVGPADPSPKAGKGKKRCGKGKVRRKGRCVKKKPRAGKKKQQQRSQKSTQKAG